MAAGETVGDRMCQLAHRATLENRPLAMAHSLMKHSNVERVVNKNEKDPSKPVRLVDSNEKDPSKPERLVDIHEKDSRSQRGERRERGGILVYKYSAD